MEREAKQSQKANIDFFRGGGEMGERIRSFNWENSPLGPTQHWQGSLKTAVRIILDSRYPMFLWWGTEFINLYNDAFIPVLGERHPDALGRPAPEIWSELWGTLGPQAKAVLESGESSWNDQALLIMERHGYREETYFTFSYSPAPNDAGGVGGVFCACTEDTHRVLGERRLRTLRQLSTSTGSSASAQEACKIAAATLEERAHDVPFALFYLLGANEEEARLVASAGLEPGVTHAPQIIPLLSGSDTIWPLELALTGSHQILHDQAWKNLPGGPWAEPVKTAAVLPLIDGGQTKPAGFLIVGASPLLAFDDDYQGFFDLLASSVASSIAKARALDDVRKRAKALAEIDRAKTVFFSNVAHELETPLTSILRSIEDAMAQDDRLAPEVRSDLYVAHRNGLRLLRLVNGILDLSHIEAGRMSAVYQLTDLASLTRDLASVFRSTIEKAGL
ncbi:MAG TPA: histidine kinase dimerization/phospho-acceptor domain-containing protein, partial [Bryobacteraceae bacterium]|nr:histidine kinase dimerization/phospho-acceptor domain-containing protein [Bryobacteraceae bacterium]